MKISILINSLSGGGAERFVSHLVPYLEQRGVDVHLVLINDNVKYQFITKNKVYVLDNLGLKSGLLNFIMTPYLVYRYNRYLKSNNINYCLSFLTRSNYISVLIKMLNHSRYLILSERSFPSAQYGYNNFQARINLFLIKKTFPKADKIITNSKGNARDLINIFKISKEKVRTSYNPVDFDFIQKVKPIQNFYNKDHFNIICVGRFDEGKNHNLLITSFTKLKSKNVRCYIFGDGPLANKLQEQINILNLNASVFLMPFQSNIYQYMKAADLFVFSSNHEGFPNVLLEAMSCGLPIISTNCPSGPNELLQSDLDYYSKKSDETEYGILVPNNDEGSMAIAIDKLVNDQDYYLRCQKNVKKRAQDFTAIKVLSEYFDEIFPNGTRKQ